MNSKNMTMVRIYLSEDKAHLETLMSFLHDVERIKGVTVYRGIEGYGNSGQIHTSSLLDLSMSLPIVVEFFDDSDKAEDIISHIENNFKSAHIVSWPVHVRV